jgi:thymidylate synthase
MNIEQQYLASLREILDYGEEKHPERKLEAGRKLSHYTKGVSCIALSHYMSDGFPLMTHKKMGLKNIAIELEGFIKGITDKAWYEQRGCMIWHAWANPEAVKQAYQEWYYKPWRKRQDEIDASGFLYFSDPNILISFESVKNDIQKALQDLGPIYGYQWRKFNEHYNCDDGPEQYGWRVGNDWEVNGVEKGVDQLKEVVDSLKNNPDDRRMVCSAWNPNQFNFMALPPCHMMWGVSHWNGKLDLWWVQRSADALLGVPYNIASYGLLLQLLAKEAGMKANKLTGWFVDYHLYSNQFEAAKQALARQTYQLPMVEILGKKSIFNWTHEDMKLSCYDSEGLLDKVEVVV